MKRKTLAEQLKERKEKQAGSVETSEPSVGMLSSLGPSRIPAVDIGSERVNTAVVNNRKVLAIDPGRCKPWKLHDRSEGWLSKKELKDLADSISEVSQRQYGLVRKIEGDPNYDYEIIFGVRRCRACQLLGIAFKAELTDADDKACYRLMHHENESREDLSVFEKALSYQKALADGLYDSEEELRVALELQDRHYRKIMRFLTLSKSPSVMGFVLADLPHLSFRVGERLIKSVEEINDETILEGVVTDVSESLADHAGGLDDLDDERNGLAVLAAALEKRRGVNKPKAKTERPEPMVVLDNKAVIWKQRNGRGVVTLKIDPSAKDLEDPQRVWADLLDRLWD